MTDVVALVGRTSDRAHGRAAGAQALARAPGGLDTTQLRDLLADVAARARIVGAEITCFSTPELSGVLAQAAAPLLESPAS